MSLAGIGDLATGGDDDDLGARIAAVATHRVRTDIRTSVSCPNSRITLDGISVLPDGASPEVLPTDTVGEVGVRGLAGVIGIEAVGGVGGSDVGDDVSRKDVGDGVPTAGEVDCVAGIGGTSGGVEVAGVGGTRWTVILAEALARWWK